VGRLRRRAVITEYGDDKATRSFSVPESKGKAFIKTTANFFLYISKDAGDSRVHFGSKGTIGLSLLGSLPQEVRYMGIGRAQLRACY
jgi:hypothetical protein